MACQLTGRATTNGIAHRDDARFVHAGLLRQPVIGEVFRINDVRECGIAVSATEAGEFQLKDTKSTLRQRVHERERILYAFEVAVHVKDGRTWLGEGRCRLIERTHVAKRS